MAKNKLSDLRDHLFETLEGLKDPDAPMDIERAKAVGLISGKIIDSAKVEVAFLKMTGERDDSSFFDGVRKDDSAPVRRLK